MSPAKVTSRAPAAHIRARWVPFTGGFILAFHDLPAARFAALVDGLSPCRPVHLADLLERRSMGRSTRGLFAITVDDGVGETVRHLSAAAIARHWPITFFLPTGYLDNPGGLPFQWIRQIASQAPFTRLRFRGGSADFSTSGSRRRFESDMLDRMHGQRPEQYLSLIDDLVNQGIEAGWFVPARHGPPAAITWNEVATLAAHDEIRFESHGVSHTATSALEAEPLERELRNSRERIERHTGKRCRYFAYPFGSPRSIGTASPGIVARYYDGALTMTRGRLGHADAFLLPRVPLYPKDTPTRAWLKVLTAR